MNAKREVHEDDDLTPQQLEEIYGDQASELGERLAEPDRRRRDGVPVADDEQLDTDIVDEQYADLAELNAGLSPDATADDVAELHRRWLAQHEHRTGHLLTPNVSSVIVCGEFESEWRATPAEPQGTRPMKVSSWVPESNTFAEVFRVGTESSCDPRRTPRPGRA